MDPLDGAPELKKIRFGKLEPELQREVRELAAELGHEAAINAGSSLSFLVTLYKAEKAKERKSREALKKAEDMIMRLGSLHYGQARKETAREGQREGRRDSHFRIRAGEGALAIGKTLKAAFESIGITDEKDMERAVGLLGENKAAERIELVKITALGEELTKKLFGSFPDLILVHDEAEFVSDLEALEGKKEVIDQWRQAGKELPGEADYRLVPGILLESYHEIARCLSLKPEIRRTPTGDIIPAYKGKPMDPDDFMKVVLTMGFEVVREANHGTLLRSATGIMCVQRAHRKQMQLNPSTIKKKLIEAGVDLDQFEGARRELKL